MRKYEIETGKKSIWRGSVTEGFKKWQKGEKIYESDKKRIMLLVSDVTKEKWQDFAKRQEYPTVSKLIRTAMNHFISFTENERTMKDFSQLSHALKEPLTVLKGNLHLFMEEYKNKLEWEILSKLKDVYDQGEIIEKRIETILGDVSLKMDPFDILIVEDEISTNNMLVNFFGQKGLKCKGIVKGSNLIETIAVNRPKLILLDILLPDINGFEMCKKIKEDDRYKNIPVYYITAIPGHEVEKRMEDTKADGYFLKPFNFPKLERFTKNLIKS